MREDKRTNEDEIHSVRAPVYQCDGVRTKRTAPYRGVLLVLVLANRRCGRSAP